MPAWSRKPGKGRKSVVPLGPRAALGVVAGLGLAIALVAQRAVTAAPALPAAFDGEVKAGVVIEAEQIALHLHRRLVTQGGRQRARARCDGQGQASSG